MIINHVKEGTALTISLVGRLDSTTENDLINFLNQQITPDLASLTFDLKEVDFISSRGIRVLISTYKSFPNHQVFLTNPNSSVREVLNLSGLLTIFHVE